MDNPTHVTVQAKTVEKALALLGKYPFAEVAEVWMELSTEANESFAMQKKAMELQLQQDEVAKRRQQKES